MLKEVKNIKELIEQSLRYVTEIERGADNELAKHFALGEKSALVYILTVIEAQERAKNTRNGKKVNIRPIRTLR